jgi:hypothetical protein
VTLALPTLCPIKQFQFKRLKGARWELFSDLISGDKVGK